MQRKLSLIVCIFIILANICPVSADTTVVEKPDVKIFIDGKLGVYSTSPITSGGRTLLPLRELLIKLGVPNDNAHIIWNSEENSVTIIKDSIKLYLKVGSTKAFVNDVVTTLDVAAVNYKGSVYIPARFVAQSFGKEVDWDKDLNGVIIGQRPDPKIKQVVVADAKDFVNELGSNKRILLKKGKYSLSNIKHLNSDDKNITWEPVYDGEELNLKNITNLEIEGLSPTQTEIIVTPRFAEIINFSNCNNISIKNIKMGHTPSEYECDAGVLTFSECADISIQSSELYGCGSIGIKSYGTKRLVCTDTIIDHCSLRALNIYDSEQIIYSMQALGA